MSAITIIFHAPRLGYVTYHSGGMHKETGHGYPTSKYPVWDASHFSQSERNAFAKEVCNSRGCVEDLTRLRDFLVAWGCKPLDVQMSKKVTERRTAE